MPDNVDEDLIEATIRRVAEAKAAREQLPEPAPTEATNAAPASSRSPSKPGPDEDAIEATIRRVQAQKAAADSVSKGSETPVEGAAAQDPDQDTQMNHELAPAVHQAAPDEDAIEATIRRVQAQKAAVDAAANDDGPPAGAANDGPDEDAIAATIRRVRAQKREQELSDDELGIVSPAASHGEETPLAAAIAASELALDPDSFEPVSEVSANDDAIARLERALREAHHAIAGLTARVEALERAPQRGPAHPAQLTALPTRQQPEEDWDEDAAQIVQPAGLGGAPRPAILRDPVGAPRTALAEQLPEPELIDTRPLPKPLPPIQVESRRGLDLLPRTYRITVEDKRRGVDLVPLHRALLSMDGVRDMSLLSYNNGVAIVALETTGDLDSDGLGKFVSRAMSRAAKVEQHNEHTFVVKLAED